MIYVRMDPGEDVLESLREAVNSNSVQNAIIVSGVGSLSRYHVHVVETTNLPPGNVYFKDSGPFDILTVTGMVLDGRVHAHITASNTDRAIGGHLEEGCEVLTFAIVGLMATADSDFSEWDRVGPLKT